ncbi:hypothetical protein Tco_0895381 [Tanacetum coccineum]|uniref:Uncharacterized protein n=1 Tax=Tanacetum coccineum TaxID=301880 RepID=A0ABQ5CFM8_9ASTR
MSAKDTIAVQRYGLSAKELNEFLSFYPIPSEYDVILPTSTQIIFDAPPDSIISSKYPQLLLDENKLNLKSFKYKLPPNIDENPYFQHLGRYPTSVRVFDDPILFLAGLKPSLENFIYTEDDDDLAFLPKEPSSGFSTGSPSASVNTKLPKDVEEPEVQPAEITTDSGESPKAGVFVVHPESVAARIKKRRCKTRGGSSRPPVKRKLASGSSSSRAVHAKTFASKNDAHILSISDDDEGKFSVHLVLFEGIDFLIHPLSSLYILLGLPDCFELKDANACHLKISVITPPAWKGHLDNQIDLELPDLHDCCYARRTVVDNAVKRRAREFLQVIEKMSEFDQNPAVLALREKISSLTIDVKEHKGNLDRMMLESQKWAGYQVTLSTLESKVDSLKAEKAKLDAVEASLRREVEEPNDELGRLVGTLVSAAITYGRCRAYEQVAAMKEPFDLSKAKGYCSSYKKDGLIRVDLESRVKIEVGDAPDGLEASKLSYK